MTTFLEIGIDIPLFRADISQSSSYLGIENCHLCGAERLPCFDITPPAGFVASCTNCKTRSIPDGLEKEDWICPTCRASLIPKYFTEIPGSIGPTPLRACFDCLLKRKAAILKPTELGLFTLSSVEADGLRFERPGSSESHLALPAEICWSFARTPDYRAIQGGNWLFCCQGPMFFEGRWTNEDFESSAGAHFQDGFDFFSNTIENTRLDFRLGFPFHAGTRQPHTRDITKELWDGSFGGVRGFYVFQCDTCGRYRTRWDHD